MQKHIKIILIIFLLQCAACNYTSGESTQPYSYKDSDNLITDDNNDTSINSSDNDTIRDDSVPAYMWDFYNAYIQLEENYNFSFHITSTITGGSSDEHYSFDFIDQEESNVKGHFYTSESNRLLPSKNVRINFSDKFHPSSIKDFITATLLIIDTSLDLNSATELSQAIASSYSDSTDSIIYSSSEYSLFLRKSYYFSGINMYLVYHDNINFPVDTNEYSYYSYEEMLAPLNFEEKSYITGTISDIIFDETIGDFLYVIADDGNSYEIYFEKSIYLEYFEVDKTYTFYGQNRGGGSDDIIGLILHFCDPLD